ncbi:2303_t:CDS:2, partial [Acaulospora colombiana]
EELPDEEEEDSDASETLQQPPSKAKGKKKDKALKKVQKFEKVMKKATKHSDQNKTDKEVGAVTKDAEKEMNKMMMSNKQRKLYEKMKQRRCLYEEVARHALGLSNLQFGERNRLCEDTLSQSQDLPVVPMGMRLVAGAVRQCIVGSAGFFQDDTQLFKPQRNRAKEEDAFSWISYKASAGIGTFYPTYKRNDIKIAEGWVSNGYSTSPKPNNMGYGPTCGVTTLYAV